MRVGGLRGEGCWNLGWQSSLLREEFNDIDLRWVPFPTLTCGARCGGGMLEPGVAEHPAACLKPQRQLRPASCQALGTGGNGFVQQVLTSVI